ncbi:MAG: fructosamine-3-kinase [Paraglaciecola sp.]|jgi:fructosamine-3-kinase
MWHFISDQISQQIGNDFICDDIREVPDGDSHKAFKISDGKRRFFVKINDKDQLTNFEAESTGLDHLQKAEIFRVPKVICLGTVSNHSFLVLEHINMQPGSKQAWFEFGQKLAQLHKLQTQQMYGWQEDNFIGLTPQPNQWQKKWGCFFAEQRIGFMLQLLSEQGHELADIDHVVDLVKQLLTGHNPTPSMLHGDLWQGNTGFNNDQAVLFDPAFYFGDREAELAMTELFSRFPGDFYHGYEDVWPVDLDYQYRKPVYQLYHILNHALLFGGQYLHSAKSNLNNLAA